MNESMTMAQLAEEMRDIDFAMLSTVTDGGNISARPMSNNGEVDYDGESWFFTFEQARTVTDIERNPKVGLSYAAKKGLLGHTPLFISIEGNATLIRDRSAFAAHWTEGLNKWFEQGPDTPGIVLIRVAGERIHYWDGMRSGEMTL